jgi:AraC family transcriptional regulator of adaptative response/methylated-DNA-[protein]-cysteine methyltransferase
MATMDVRDPSGVAGISGPARSEGRGRRNLPSGDHEHDLQVPGAGGLTDTAAWQAVLDRDERFDGRFVCAVRSTRIYCRPSCPSKRPRRAGAEFFANPEAAERAGYRACRRCLPRLPESPAAAAVGRAVRYLDAHLDAPVSLATLGRAAGMSPSHLQRVFQRRLGLSPREYVRACRLDRLKRRLKEGETVTTATYEAGFGSGRQVYDGAARDLGMTPAVYGRGGAGMTIRFAIVRSRLGWLLVGATNRGLCAASLGGRAGDLERSLRLEYPAARIERGGADLDAWVRPVVDRLEGLRVEGAVPIDVPATAFQRRVWKALREIPFGATRSYGELAAAIGRPDAARAVARACATNKVAVVIPCHRVVAAGGGVGGYRWGVARKKKLLAAEKPRSM